MSSRTWTLILGGSALASVAVAFLGTSVPLCSAPVGGTVSAACIATWEAGWSLPERLVQTYGTPVAAGAVFLFFVALGAVAHVSLRRRQRQG